MIRFVSDYYKGFDYEIQSTDRPTKDNHPIMILTIVKWECLFTIICSLEEVVALFVAQKKNP